MLYKYKNASESVLAIVGVGSVQPGQEFNSRRLLENPNLHLIGETAEQENKVTAVAETSPGVVTEAEQVKTEENIQ